MENLEASTYDASDRNPSASERASSEEPDLELPHTPPRDGVLERDGTGPEARGADAAADAAPEQDRRASVAERRERLSATGVVNPGMPALYEAVVQGDLDYLEAAAAQPWWLALPEGEKEYLDRELERLGSKARRASLEALHLALRGADSERLLRAIEVARRRAVPADEVEAAEASVEAMQERERQEKDGLFRRRDCKAEAFAAIAGDDPVAFEAAVRGQPWEKWRDDAGDDLLAAAEKAGAAKVLELLRAGDWTDADRLAAFRLVVKDDVRGLEALLLRCSVSPFVWAAWRNKGGKSLLHLAEERESHEVYTWLSLAAGRVQFLLPERTAVGDAVWVFTPASLQPRQAKVVGPEGTTWSPHANVEVAYMDESSGTHWVDPSQIRKMKV